MKILAIRGCNLASLAGEFEIDLARGPLGMAGVFAIVGPTGAGKSTLLDAMCVALFDRTPRLPGHSRVVVGHGDEDPLALGAQDPRTLLRRGATHGWAEVDFESGDARRYRARWSVRRARGAMDGNLQDQQVSLVALDRQSVITERLGGTKMETLKAIHQRLGLTFDQFRRSALLAQGDFAAFLRADGKDRSELLERMTGTEVYSKLSIAAHAHAVAAEQRLRERQAAALAIPVLSPDARADAEQGVVLANQAREVARVRLAEATAFATWRGEAAARHTALAQAEVELAVAQAEARGAETLRGELAVRRRAEALRGVWDEAARLDRQHSIARGEVVKALAAFEAARTAHLVIGETRERVSELHGVIRQARIAAAIVEVEAPKQLAPFMGSVEAAEEQGQAALEPAAWLVARRSLAPEISGWPELEARLVQERTLADAITGAERVLAEQQAQHAALVAKERSLIEARDRAQHKLTEATREADSFVKKRSLGLDAAGRAEDEARTRCAEVDRLVSTANGARAAAQILAELLALAAELDASTELDRVRRDAITGELAAAIVLRDERARVVGELRKAAGYEHARTELVDGEPCPLCGAEEHPWKHKGAFDALITAAEDALAEAAARVGEAQRMLAQLDAREGTREVERARIASTRLTAQQSAESYARDWRERMSALGELVLVTDPSLPEAGKLALERFDAAKAKLESARATRASAEAAHKAIADAQAKVKVCQLELDHHTAELRSLGAELAAAASAIERTRGERDTKAERRCELGRELVEIAMRWHAALPDADRAELIRVPNAVASLAPLARDAMAALLGDAGPDTPAPKRGTKVAGAATAMAGAPKAKRAAPKRERTAADDGRELDEMAAQPVVIVDELSAWGIADAAHKQPTAIVIARAALAAFVEAWHQRATVVARAEAVLAQAVAEIETAARSAERSIADAAARDAEAKKRSAGLAAELFAANAALDAARVAAGFEREALQRVLAADPSRVDQLVEDLERLDRAVDRANTRIAERRRLVDAHAAARPTPEVLDIDRLAARSTMKQTSARDERFAAAPTPEVMGSDRLAGSSGARDAHAAADAIAEPARPRSELDIVRIAASSGARDARAAADANAEPARPRSEVLGLERVGADSPMLEASTGARDAHPAATRPAPGRLDRRAAAFGMPEATIDARTQATIDAHGKRAAEDSDLAVATAGGSVLALDIDESSPTEVAPADDTDVFSGDDRYRRSSASLDADRSSANERVVASGQPTTAREPGPSELDEPVLKSVVVSRAARRSAAKTTKRASPAGSDRFAEIAALVNRAAAADGEAGRLAAAAADGDRFAEIAVALTRASGAGDVETPGGTAERPADAIESGPPSHRAAAAATNEPDPFGTVARGAAGGVADLAAAIRATTQAYDPSATQANEHDGPGAGASKRAGGRGSKSRKSAATNPNRFDEIAAAINRAAAGGPGISDPRFAEIAAALERAAANRDAAVERAAANRDAALERAAANRDAAVERADANRDAAVERADANRDAAAEAPAPGARFAEIVAAVKRTTNAYAPDAAAGEPASAAGELDADRFAEIAAAVERLASEHDLARSAADLLAATVAKVEASTDRFAEVDAPLDDDASSREHDVARSAADQTAVAVAHVEAGADRLAGGSLDTGDAARSAGNQMTSAGVRLIHARDVASSSGDPRSSDEAPEVRNDDNAAIRAAVARVEADANHLADIAAAVKHADERAAQLVAAIAADNDACDRREAALAMFSSAERAAEVDRILGAVIGSHDGKLFRSFAQSLTLDQLLSVANSHLEELAPRYQLERVPKHDLELQVIDRDFGSEVRSVQSLSGGESFLVSLALALGLSSMSAHDVRVRTLLIDEGFGTLDPATLDSALAVLDELQATGRQVGVISHVPALLDRVRAHVRVMPRGGGRSEVWVPPS